ncbi:MAG: hypothetical protein ACM3TU_03280 [Bacillota bacterium]
MDPLSRLFGTPARLKLLRLFLFNDDAVISIADAATRTKISKDAARKEVNALTAAGILKKKKTAQGSGYSTNKKFAHYDALKVFVRDTTDVRDVDILTTLRRAGTLRVVTLSGLFSGALESKVDILVVGDRLEERPLAHAIHSLEAELGRELRYACFSTEDFKYRVSVYDRLVRDVFDYPHRTILDRINLAS